MVRIIRKLNNRRNWFKTQTDTDFSWLAPDELIGDVFDDILPRGGGKLSVYIFDDDEDIVRICTALAIGRNSRSNADYVIIDEDILKNEGFEYIYSSGKTAYESVNVRHNDIIKLSSSELLRLAKILKIHGEFNTISWKKIAKHVAESIIALEISKDNVKIASEKFWAEVDKHFKEK